MRWPLANVSRDSTAAPLFTIPFHSHPYFRHLKCPSDKNNAVAEIENKKDEPESEKKTMCSIEI